MKRTIIAAIGMLALSAPAFANTDVVCAFPQDGTDRMQNETFLNVKLLSVSAPTVLRFVDNLGRKQIFVSTQCHVTID